MNVIDLPLYSPKPFCGYTFLNVEYKLTDANGEKWQESWLTYTATGHQIVIKLDENLTASHKVCLVSAIPKANISQTQCFQVQPIGYTPPDLAKDYVEKSSSMFPVNADELQADSDDKYLDEQALKKEWIRELEKEYPDEIAYKTLNTEESLYF